jgi:hypothetical protein
MVYDQKFIKDMSGRGDISMFYISECHETLCVCDICKNHTDIYGFASKCDTRDDCRDTTVYGGDGNDTYDVLPCYGLETDS